MSDTGLPLEELRQQARSDSRVPELEREIQILNTRLDALSDAVDRLEDGASGPVRMNIRERMLPVHRMWADIRTGDAETLGKGDRRAATIFGAFVRQVVDAPPTDEEFLPYNGVDASGQTFSLTSTEAKRTLEEAPHIQGRMYSETVRRVFEDVQRYTKDDTCKCASIDFCDHGLVVFHNPKGTNLLAVAKDTFRDRMAAVQAAGGDGGPDDPVRPTTGQGEGADRTGIEADGGELSNIVVSKPSAETLADEPLSED